MKDYLAELVRTSPTPAHSRNLVREYLQARILGALQRAAAMIPLAFHGGTALRFLFASARYSEDLDFALEKDKSRYDFRAYLQAIRSELAIEGYAVQLKINDKKPCTARLSVFPACFMNCAYRAIAAKCLRSKSKWTPIRRLGQS